jgi:aspartyl-tRNA(Asn)/glutamyl-tRNA(Gln) amidotransferase subunit A
MIAPELRRIVDLAPLVRSGVISPVDLVRGCLAQMDARPEINAFITRFDDRALGEAQEREREIRSGHYRGPLHGIPVSIKDLIDVAGTRTTAGSAMPSPVAAADAPTVAQLRAAGAIPIGKTNLHEFAFGTTSEESAFGPVRNPHDLSRSAGGSSGGAAAALAAGMCFGALGTDTGGSIRIPSAACGTVGLKPTTGEISCEGVIPLSTTLDHVGPMARSVADVRWLFEALTSRQPISMAQRSTARTNGRLTFGVPGPYFCDRIDPGVQQALDRSRQTLQAAGHVIRDVEIVHAAWTPDVYLHIVLPEAAQYHAPFLERHASHYCPGVRLRLEMGRYLLAEDYVRAMRLRDALTTAVDRALEGCDALLAPALAIPAPPLGASTVDVRGTAEPVRAAMLRLTQLFNLTGHPSIALPAWHDVDHLPRSLQIVGRRHQTDDLLAIAAAAEPLISGGPAAAC